jgi:hypothetical protein
MAIDTAILGQTAPVQAPDLLVRHLRGFGATSLSRGAGEVSA